MSYYYIQISDHGKNTYSYYQTLIEMTTAASFLQRQNNGLEIKGFIENVKTHKKEEVI